MKGRMQAMQKLPPTSPQLEYLTVLGYEGPVPGTMAEASAKIAELIQQKQRQKR